MAQTMKIRWLKRALENLNDEAQSMARTAPHAAGEFARTLLENVDAASKRPDGGRPGRVPGTRELALAHFPYVAVYRVRENELEILRVFHTGRKWPRRVERVQTKSTN